MLEYHRADVSDREEVARALGPLCEPVLAYLALPPAVFAPAIETLSGVGLEKHFGEDLASA